MTLDELDAVYAAMTPGPWEYVFADCKEPHTIMGPKCVEGGQTSIAHTPWDRPKEADTFRGIVALHNHYPALRKRIRRAEELLRAAVNQCQCSRHEQNCVGCLAIAFLSDSKKNLEVASDEL